MISENHLRLLHLCVHLEDAEEKGAKGGLKDIPSSDAEVVRRSFLNLNDYRQACRLWQMGKTEASRKRNLHKNQIRRVITDDNHSDSYDNNN